MNLRLARSKKERTKNVLILDFSIRGARFMFGLFNPLVLFSRPKRLHWWINMCPGRVWDWEPTHTYYWGHIICLYYDMHIPLKKGSK